MPWLYSSSIVKTVPAHGKAGKSHLRSGRFTLNGSCCCLPLLLTLSCILWATISSQAQTMKRVFDKDTPAHRAALKFMRGINIGNALEYTNGSPAGGLTYNSSDFALIKSEGFDHVRIPVAWHLYCGPAPTYTIANSIFTRTDALVNAALAKNLAVIVDLHHFEAFNTGPASSTNQFYAIWRQVAAHYANSPSNVAFELLNEPHNIASTASVNRYFPEAIRQVRVTNPDRTIFIGPGNYNGMAELTPPSVSTTSSGLVLPNDDLNLIVTVHCYDPYYFTHQGAEWAFDNTRTVGVIFPGPPVTPIKPDSRINQSFVLQWFRDYNTKSTSLNPSSAVAFRSSMRNLRAWADYYGRPVHLGEFGCYEKADRASRVEFHRQLREEMDARGLGWCMWDWKAGFHYIRNGRPDPPEMRESIFPPIQLRVNDSGTIEFNSAIGKTFVIQRTESLVAPVSWQNVATQTLSTPNFSHSLDKTRSDAGGFYQVLWVK